MAPRVACPWVGCPTLGPLLSSQRSQHGHSCSCHRHHHWDPGKPACGESGFEQGCTCLVPHTFHLWRGWNWGHQAISFSIPPQVVSDVGQRTHPHEIYMPEARTSRRAKKRILFSHPHMPKGLSEERTPEIRSSGGRQTKDTSQENRLRGQKDVPQSHEGKGRTTVPLRDQGQDFTGAPARPYLDPQIEKVPCSPLPVLAATGCHQSRSPAPHESGVLQQTRAQGPEGPACCPGCSWALPQPGPAALGGTQTHAPCRSGVPAAQVWPGT